MERKIFAYIILALLVQIGSSVSYACKPAHNGREKVIINFNTNSQVSINEFGAGSEDQIVIAITENNILKTGFTLKEMCGSSLYKIKNFSYDNMDDGTNCGARPFDWYPKSIMKSSDNILSLTSDCGIIKIDLSASKIAQKGDSNLNSFQHIWAFFAPVFLYIFWKFLNILYITFILVLTVLPIAFIPALIAILIWKRKKIISYFRR